MKSLIATVRRAPYAILLGLAACGGSQDPIVIGLAGPLSRANGESMQLAARMAVEEINNDGGINGRRVELLERDDEASEQKAIAIAYEFRANPAVVAVIGHVNSAMSLKAAPIYNQPPGDDGRPILQISPASSAPELSREGGYTFRVCPTDLEFSPALAAHARSLGRSRAAILYANDDYGRGVASTFRNAFQQAGGAVVSADPYLPDVLRDAQGVDAYLTRALRRDVDALVIGGQAEAGLAIIRAARRLGFTGPILGADGLTGVKDGGPIAEGVFVSSAFLPDRDEQAARAFVAAYEGRYQKLPDHRGAMTYDVVYLLRRAIEEAGADREALRSYVSGIGTRHAAHDGVSGRIAFDENGDVVNKPITIGVVREGRLVTASR